jgi:hypothetical protein
MIASKSKCKDRYSGQDYQYTITSIGLAGQDCQDRLQCRTAKAGIPGHDFRNRTARADFAMI